MAYCSKSITTQGFPTFSSYRKLKVFSAPYRLFRRPFYLPDLVQYTQVLLLAALSLTWFLGKGSKGLLVYNLKDNGCLLKPRFNDLWRTSHQMFSGWAMTLTALGFAVLAFLVLIYLLCCSIYWESSEFIIIVIVIPAVVVFVVVILIIIVVLFLCCCRRRALLLLCCSCVFYWSCKSTFADSFTSEQEKAHGRGFIATLVV